MACTKSCRLCSRLIISTAVSVNAEGVIVTIPSGCYENNGRYCIVIAQSIPASAPIGSDVFIQIGEGGEEYPLVGCGCRPVTVCGIRTRTRYRVEVETTPTSGVFRMLGRASCSALENLRALEG